MSIQISNFQLSPVNQDTPTRASFTAMFKGREINLSIEGFALPSSGLFEAKALAPKSVKTREELIQQLKTQLPEEQQGLAEDIINVFSEQLSTSTEVRRLERLVSQGIQVDRENKIIDLNVTFKKGETAPVKGFNYEEELGHARRFKPETESYTTLDDARLVELDETYNSIKHKEHINKFKEGGGTFVPHFEDSERIGIVTKTDPKDGKFEFQHYDSSIDIALVEQALDEAGFKVGDIRSVVVVVYRKKEEGKNQVLVHKHDEPKEAWGFEQNFWSYPGGICSEGVINTALNETYEESGFQLPSVMAMTRIRIDERKRGNIAYIYFEDKSHDLEEMLEPKEPINQFWGFSKKLDPKGERGTQKILFPRSRGDFDSRKVLWADVDVNTDAGEKEPFIKHSEIESDHKEGRFGSFTNEAVLNDLNSVLNRPLM